jgi:hypothetical protein
VPIKLSTFAGWKNLDDVLSSLPTLHKVFIYLNSNVRNAETTPQLQLAMEALLGDRGILSVVTGDTIDLET